MMKVNTTWLRESSTQLRQLAKRIDRVLEQMAEIRRRLYDSCEMGGQLPEMILKDYFKLGHQYDTLLKLAKALSAAAAQYERCEQWNQIKRNGWDKDRLREILWPRIPSTGLLGIPEWMRRIFFYYPIRWKRNIFQKAIAPVECAAVFEKLELNRIIRVGDEQD